MIFSASNRVVGVNPISDYAENVIFFSFYVNDIAKKAPENSEKILPSSFVSRTRKWIFLI